MRGRGLVVAVLTASVVLGAGDGARAAAPTRASLWVDLYRGEPVTFDAVVDDLASVDVVYLGERHTILRHHDVQRQVVEALVGRGVKVVLGLEQAEARHQGALDRYGRGLLDFDGLARDMDWGASWKNYDQYRGVVEAAVAGDGVVVGLNAPADLIREIGRGGLSALTPERRRLLPPFVLPDEPRHRQRTLQQIQVHAGMMAERLGGVVEAQTARDETMAASMAAALRRVRPSAGDRHVVGVVICGSGHCAHGIGIPQRLRARMPELRDRIIHMSESGDLVLTEAERKMARDVEVTHESLRFLDVPLADYLQVVEPRPVAAP